MPRDYKVYLEDILQAADRIKAYTVGLDLPKFSEDLKTSDAVVRNLEIIGEAVKHIPDEIRLRHPQIEWRKIGSLRDILAHEYFGLILKSFGTLSLTKSRPLRPKSKNCSRPKAQPVG